jgi:hypothetical protein
METTSLVIGIIVGVLTILGVVSGVFKRLLAFARRKLRDNQGVPAVPTKTVVIVPDPFKNATWWHMGSSSKEPGMQVSGGFTVTNISTSKVLLTSAKMRKPRILGHVFVQEIGAGAHGTFAIPPGESTSMVFDFWIQPPVKREGEVFVADVAIQDQYGNEHWIKKVEFKYL